MNSHANTPSITRRRFLATAVTTPVALQVVPRHVLGGAGQTAPSEKLNIAGIGIGGMGSGDIRAVRSENIVALCDFDQRALDRNAKDFPNASIHRTVPAGASDECRRPRFLESTL